MFFTCVAIKQQIIFRYFGEVLCFKFMHPRSNCLFLCKPFFFFPNLCFAQVPWMQVSRSRSLLLMVRPAVFLAAIGMGSYVLLLGFAILIFCHIEFWHLLILLVYLQLECVVKILHTLQIV